MVALVRRYSPFSHDIRPSPICRNFRKICGVSLQMGVAGNAPTVAAVIANGAKIGQNGQILWQTGQTAWRNGADTQVCPYNTRKFFLYLPLICPKCRFCLKITPR
jgi:hypothetical protein